MCERDREFWGCRTDDPAGFSSEKGEPMYWLDAVREFWATTNFDTDSIDLAAIVNWFDDYRKREHENPTQ